MPANYTARSAITTILSTELNSLASGSVCALGGTVDNDTAGVRDLYGQVEIYIAAQGANRAVGAYIAVYFVPESDGTNFGAVVDECLDNYFVGTVSFDDGALAARYAIIDRVRIPVGDFKPAIKNVTGQALAASGNTVKLRAYTLEDAA